MMDTFSLNQATAAMKGKMFFHGNAQSVLFEGVSTDTRKDCQNKLFFALRGDHYDAHDHLDSALNAGAGAVVVEQDVMLSRPAGCARGINLQSANGY